VRRDARESKVELSTARKVPSMHAQAGDTRERTIIFYRYRVSARFMYMESPRARVIESRIKFDIKKQRLLEILTTRTAHARWPTWAWKKILQQRVATRQHVPRFRGLTAESNLEPKPRLIMRRGCFTPRRKLRVLRNFRGRRECISSRVFPMHPARHDEHEESRKRSASLYPLAKLRTLGITALAPNSSIWISALRGCSSEFASNAGAGGVKKIC